MGGRNTTEGEMQIQKLPSSYRVETGRMQVEGDWPGVFIRGDDALGYSRALRQAFACLNDNPDIVIRPELEGLVTALPRLQELADLLASCDARSDGSACDG